MQEWELEPNIRYGKYRNYKWMILRHQHMGHLCGYVAFRPNSPYYEVGYDTIPCRLIECHGGPTFAGRFEFKTLSKRMTDDEKVAFRKFFNGKDWWLGFDCGHYEDLIPFMDLGICKTSRYRNMEYCEKEIQSMIGQVCELTMQKYIIDLYSKEYTDRDAIVHWAREHMKTATFNDDRNFISTNSSEEYMLYKLTWE